MMLEPHYIVGFVDGEGTFNIIKYPNNRRRPQMLVFNTNREILESIKNTLSIDAPIFEASRVNDGIKRTKICYRLQVRSKKDLFNVVNFFDKNLPIIKIRDYNNFRVCFFKWLILK